MAPNELGLKVEKSYESCSNFT